MEIKASLPKAEILASAPEGLYLVSDVQVPTADKYYDPTIDKFIDGPFEMELLALVRPANGRALPGGVREAVQEGERQVIFQECRKTVLEDRP